MEVSMSRTGEDKGRFKADEVERDFEVKPPSFPSVHTYAVHFAA